MFCKITYLIASDDGDHRNMEKLYDNVEARTFGEMLEKLKEYDNENMFVLEAYIRRGEV